MSEDRLEKDMENAVRDFDRLVSCLEGIIDPETRAELAQTIISHIEWIQEWIQDKYPDLIDSNFLYNKGDCYIELGQHEAARDVLQQAQKLDPNDPTILSDLGHAYLELGQHADAKGAFKRACALDKSVPHPHLGLARVMDATGGNKGTIKRHLKAAYDRATCENASGKTLMSLWAELLRIFSKGRKSPLYFWI
jgi:tetratricopeptide (TPR) repeat protein